MSTVNLSREMESLVRGGVKVRGGLIRTASARDEWYEDVLHPEAIPAALRARRVKADLFTFIQRLPHAEPAYPYFLEWDNVAAIHITSYEDWWNNLLAKSTRKHIRRSEKRGVSVQVVDFKDELVSAISDVYNETPIRDGMPVTHYRKDFEEMKRMLSTFPDRAVFIGAFHGEELIGFIKLVCAGQTARTMHIIAKLKHRDKWPMNALVAKAVEVCASRGIPYLVYGRLTYGKKGNQGLAAFKEENGFVKMPIPRYYIPLTGKGRLALTLKLHHGLTELLPQRIVTLARDLRGFCYTKFYLRQARRLDVCGVGADRA